MPTTQRPWRDGFRFVLVTCAVTCFLLALNGILVASLYFHFNTPDASWNRYPKLAQAIVFFTPLVLVAIQWWLIDIIARTISRRRRAEKNSS